MANLFIRSRNSLPGGNDDFVTNDKVFAFKNGQPTEWLPGINYSALRAQYGPVFWIQISYRGNAIGVLEQVTNPAVLTWGQYIPSRELIFHHGEVLRMDVMIPSISGTTITEETQIAIVEREGGAVNHKLQMSDIQSQLRRINGTTSIKDQTYEYLSQTYGDGGMNPYKPWSISNNDRVNEVLFRYQNGKPNHTYAVTIVPTQLEVDLYFNQMEGQNSVATSFCINAKTGDIFAVAGYDNIFGKFYWGHRQDLDLLKIYPVGALLVNTEDVYELQADGSLIKKS